MQVYTTSEGPPTGDESQYPVGGIQGRTGCVVLDQPSSDEGKIQAHTTLRLAHNGTGTAPRTKVKPRDVGVSKAGGPQDKVIDDPLAQGIAGAVVKQVLACGRAQRRSQNLARTCAKCSHLKPRKHGTTGYTPKPTTVPNNSGNNAPQGTAPQSQGPGQLPWPCGYPGAPF